MTSTAIPDISDVETDVVAPVATAAPDHEAAPDHAFRRFSFDPASSPVLMAALAWDTAGPRH